MSFSWDLPLVARCPFALLPTLGDTKPNALSGLKDVRFSDVREIDGGSDGETGVSDQTASTIESILEDLGSLLLNGSLLKNYKKIELGFT